MIFLLGHGISPSKSNKIYRKYGDDTIPVVTRNPYMLSMDIDGIGFLTADQIARKFNFPVDSIFRIESGILYILQVAMEEGHVHVPMDVLHNRAEKILGCTDELITEALEELVKNEKIFIDKTFDPDNPGVYLIYLYVAETESATRLTQLIQPSSSIKPVNVEKAINWVETELQIKLAEKQKQAINFSLTKKVMILTGGPGTGKTTTVNAIVHIHKVMKRKVLLAAPTGRAAKRLSEITGHEARTIHRLLEYNKPRQGFLRNEEYPLDADLIIVDESSMIDILLFYHFLKAAPLNSSLLFVGDVNQLPSVGPGNVLRDLISPGRIPLVELDEIFRQAKKSRIVLNAHQINRGELPYFRVNEENHLTDFYFVKEETPEKVLEKIVIMVTSRIPKRFGLHPGLDIQVISPMNKGVTGVDNLNKTLQSVINPDGKSIKKRNRVFRINDKVMQTRNNYNKEIYNGDIGIIMEVDAENQQLTVDFDGRQILYKTDEIDELVLAYAISVHKSQGCEFKAVILPFLTQHYLLLQRNLLYTAITRGKNLVVIVGSPRAVAMAVKNDSIQTRNSFLSNRLEMYRATGTR